MTTPSPRLQRLREQTDWDLIIVGGGITGAGILREAARRGLRALLVEQGDFASGTSSRSSQMVHGGLRYLLSADIGLTRASVHERQRLLREAPGLVEACGYLFPHRRRHKPGPRSMRTLLRIYDAFAGRRDYRFVPALELLMQAPGLDTRGLIGATRYTDAITDDARLVWRVLAAAINDGGKAVNYLRTTGLRRSHSGAIEGVNVRDCLGGEEFELHAPLVINATGAWADQLGGARNIRPLRGSHLVVPGWRLPVAQCITFMHPRDRRAVFVYPWQGASVIGTTDIDHTAPLDQEPAITAEETQYLLSGINAQFPGARLQPEDIQASWSGVRPVIGGHHDDPSRERRRHSLWSDRGLVTVSGGKLTTFRLIALDALAAGAEQLPETARKDPGGVLFPPPPALPAGLSDPIRRRLVARFGHDAGGALSEAHPGDLANIGASPVLWLEVRRAARHEAVEHLDDLLLRRTRLGLLLPDGAADYLQPIVQILAREKGWDSTRQQQELANWRQRFRNSYSVPEIHREPVA